jgi:hypothetical protein
MDADRWERKRQRWEDRWERRQARWNSRRNYPGRHLFGGVLLVVIGGIFLLGNMGLVDPHEVFQFWPVIFIVMGVSRMIASGDDYGHSGGIFWILLGCFLLSGSVEAFRGIWRNIWPMLLIGLGGFLLSRSMMFKHGRPPDPPVPGGTGGSTSGPGPAASGIAAGPSSTQGAATSSNSILSAMAILGGVERKNNCQDFRGGDVTAVMGGCHIDLRGASITPMHEPVLDVFAMWGGIEIWVPPDWTVISKVAPILGGYEDQTTPPKDESKRLVVRGSVVMGGIEVRN